MGLAGVNFKSRMIGEAGVVDLFDLGLCGEERGDLEGGGRLALDAEGERLEPAEQ